MTLGKNALVPAVETYMHRIAGPVIEGDVEKVRREAIELQRAEIEERRMRAAEAGKGKGRVLTTDGIMESAMKPCDVCKQPAALLTSTSAGRMVCGACGGL